MLCNFKISLQSNVRERGTWKKKFSESFFLKSFQSPFIFIYRFCDSFIAGWTLINSVFFFQSCLFTALFPPCLTAFELCPLTFLKFSEDQHIKDSIWQVLMPFLIISSTVLLSFTVASSNSPLISCNNLMKNIRTCQMQKTWIPGASLKGTTNRDCSAQILLTSVVKIRLMTWQLKEDHRKEGEKAMRRRTLEMEGVNNGQENLDES